TTLVAFGVSAVLKANESLFFIIKLFGAAYLLFLAYKVYSASDKITLSDSPVPKKTYGELFKQGVIMNVLNPKVSIFFLAFFPGFLFDDSLSTMTQFYVLGLLFMITSFIIFTLIAILAGLISTAIKKRKHIGVVLKWLQIVVFIAIAILILI